MNIVFLDLYSSPYTSRTPQESPLGGTQSAVAYLATALARRGHGVTVANAVSEAVTSEGVEFVGTNVISPSFFGSFDVVVMVSAALGRELRAAGASIPRVLWCHHDVDQHAVQNLLSSEERDAWSGFAMVSRWQAERYTERFGVPAARQQILRNAASPAFFDIPQRRSWVNGDRPPVLYYTSTPFRGLDALVDAMPAVRAAIPGTRLRVFSSMQLYGVASQKDEYRWLYEKCTATEGVEYVGPLPQKSLAAELAAADVHAYPSTFPETSCIAIMESMAAGSLIVSTRLGALEETTAGFAFLMPVPEYNALLVKPYSDYLVQKLCEMSQQPAVLESRLRAQRQFASVNYRWERRAEEWEHWLRTICGPGKASMPVSIQETARSLSAAGNILKAAGNLEQAISSYRRSLAMEPGYMPALYNLGLALHQSERLDEAERCFRQLVEVDPADVDSLFHLGALLQRRGQIEDAAAIFRKALHHQPGNPHLWVRLGDAGVVLKTAESLREAAECYSRALAVQSDLAEAHFGVGLACSLSREHDRAVRSFGAALALRPEEPVFRSALLAESQHICDWSQFDSLCEAVRHDALAADSESPVPNPFALLSIPSTRNEQLASARAYSRVIAARALEEAHRAGYRTSRKRPRTTRVSASDRRVRVGYLSWDFHEHVTAHCMAEVFELHDRTRVQTFGYSIGPDDGSAIRKRLERAFDRFADLRLLDDCAAAAAIEADELDVLVDLKGYTQGARAEILALRPAPVQASYLGYPATMGAEFIDYIVTDRFVVLPEHAADYSERPAYLGGSYYPSDRSRPLQEPPPRGALGLPRDGLVFCCFNQAYKISPEAFAVWMRLLATVPGSVLWLLETNPWMAPNLRAEASRLGVDPGRVVFAPKSGPAEYLRRLRAADLFLDTWPYNAHTTASDALWVGVPVVTWAGETLPSRVAASQLTALGMPELVARSKSEYEALALGLARRPDQLLALRRKLEICRSTSSLFDTPSLVRRLEDVFEEMERLHAAGMPPRTIEHLG